MRASVAWLERRQVALYLSAILVGAVLGVLAPRLAAPLEHAVTPVLALVLYATFLAVPFARVRTALADARLLTAVLVGNFVLVPLVVFALSRFVADDDALLIGVLLVLLTPCVDYVLVFAASAGGAVDRLVAATPVLLVAQLALLPAYVWLFAGPEAVAVIDPAPFAVAFVVLVVIPLVAAALTQVAAARSRAARIVRDGAGPLAMVPLLMLTLLIAIASQISRVGESAADLVRVVPIFAAFVPVAVLVGAIVARGARLDRAGAIATVFSVVTRNSLVVLPLALALPPALGLAPLVVVTQTVVELLAMVVLVALVPRWRSLIRAGG